MTRRDLMLAAAGGSFALLAGAFFFQWLGYAPCKMCLWQRWPHAVAIGLGLVALFFAPRWLAALGALAALATAGIGLYHTGVERGWWEGPTSCTGSGNALGGDLLSLDIAPVVMCDEVAWQFLTLSMASWNALFSLGFAALWIAALRRA